MENFLKNYDSGIKLDDDLVKKYAPNVVEGTHKLASGLKHCRFIIKINVQIKLFSFTIS